MLITEMRQRLYCLGWKTFDRGRQTQDGRWWLYAASCGHAIVALADSRQESNANTTDQQVLGCQ